MNGLIYQSNILTKQEQENTLQIIDNLPWNNDLKRRVQHYGYRYDYKARLVDKSMYLGEIPNFTKEIIKKLNLVNVPDQVIINEYLPGQGISPHIDCQPCFKDTIITVSLGWAYQIQFKHIHTKEQQVFLLETGSALTISDDARYNWTHEIKARKHDNGIPRQRRVSITYRNVLL